MSSLEKLLEIMAKLRDAETGCPWDQQQDFSTIAPYTIEEAYEVADAIQRNDMSALKEELGDLLLQVVYHARMAEEIDAFDFDAVAETISDKMIRRHPHVFAETYVAAAGAQTLAWEEQKAVERRDKAAARGNETSVLDDVPIALPALTRAEKLQKRAARVGFDWDTPEPVVAKVAEELDEVSAEMGENADKARLTEEVGDLLFACTNLARHLGVDPEAALRHCNGKFERRFRFIEADLARQGRHPAEATTDELEVLWEAAKRAKA